MIDKDLDNVLANLGGESEKERDAALKNRSREEAPDLDLQGAGSFVDRIRHYRMTEGILLFKGGVLQAIQEHRDHCVSFRKTSVDKEGEAGVEEMLRQYKYTYIRSVENIEKLYEDYYRVLNPATIEKSAKKDYDLYFAGFEEKNKVQFLALREMYIELREFNSLVRKEWRDLSESIGVINLLPAGKHLYQTLNSVIEAALRFCSSTDDFLNFIGHVLAIPEGHFDLLKSEIHANTAYHEELSYEFADLFDRSGGEAVTAGPGEDVPGVGDILSKGGITSGKGDPQSAVPKDDAAPPVIDEILRQHAREPKYVPPSFTVRGTRSWNTREPYIIKLNMEKLQKDVDDLTDSFYFLQAGMDEKVLEGEIKRSILRVLRDNMNIYDSYSEFVLKSVFTRINGITEFFGARDMLSLFMYHLGPLTAYLATVDAFTAAGAGYCFKYGAGKRVTRFMPQEFIKQKVLEWYENNVNVFDLPYDSIQEYENVRKLVTKRYYAAVDENSAKLDALIEAKNLKATPRFDRAEFFRTLHRDWFGADNIIVYNRFVEKTIFK